MDLNEAKQLKELEKENTELKKKLAAALRPDLSTGGDSHSVF